MLNLSQILQQTKHKATSSAITEQAENSLAEFATRALRSTVSTSVYEHADLEDVKKRLISIEQNIVTAEPRLDCQNVKTLENDEKLVDFVYLLDCLSAFNEICDIYFQDEKKENDWYAKQVKAHLKSIDKFVDQLAACISIHHDEIQTDLDMNVAVFDSSKTLATILKQQPEFKQFRKIAKRRMDFSNQALNIRSLSSIILLKTKELLSVL